ncbi:MAG: gamma-glutamyltransferase family protein [Verrucomicrobia bacterium]|nr:gamma-glutamyltransferase family protein [Verrucomicrobiota bacterium]
MTFGSRQSLKSLFYSALYLVFLCPSLFSAQKAESLGGVVVSGSPQSTEAGIRILKAGGTAADAAVAVSLALGVTEPFNSGLGGKLVVLYYDASSGKVSYIEALEAAPLGMSVEAMAKIPSSERSRGWHSAAIPGCAAGLEVMQKRWGKLSWRELVKPAVGYARDGFPLADKQIVEFGNKFDLVTKDPEAAKIYYPGGKVPTNNAILKNPDLAKTMEIMGDKGPKAFYEAEIAEKLVAASKKGGGSFAKEDFKSYKAREFPPLVQDYKSYRIYAGAPPITGGATVLLTLKSLENKVWGAIASMSLGRIEQVAHAWQNIYPVVASNLADTEDRTERINKVFSKESLADLAKKALEAMPPATTETEESPENAETTHFIVMDKAGNIVCATQSLSLHWGAAVVAPGTGILLNDSLSNFGFGPRKYVNSAEPGKRPRSTMAPVIVLEKGKPVIAIGSPASDRIPTGVYQVLSNMIDFSMDPTAAIDQPRFHLKRAKSPSEPKNALDLEEGFDASLAEELKKNWQISFKQKNQYYFGSVNVVRMMPDGKREAFADERRTNVAAGE